MMSLRDWRACSGLSTHLHSLCMPSNKQMLANVLRHAYARNHIVLSKASTHASLPPLQLEHRNSLAGAGFPRMFRDGTATAKGGKGASARVLAASGAGEEDEGQQYNFSIESSRSGDNLTGEEEDRGLRADNYGARSTSGESGDADSGLTTLPLPSDKQSGAALGHEPAAPRKRLSSSASSLSMSSSSPSSAAVRYGTPSHSRAEQSAPSPRMLLAHQLVETASYQDGRRQHNRSPSRQNGVSGRIGNGNFASGRAAALAWEELIFTQDALRETMDDLRELVSVTISA